MTQNNMKTRNQKRYKTFWKQFDFNEKILDIKGLIVRRIFINTKMSRMHKNVDFI